MRKKRPLVSVIVTTKNEEDVIEPLLRSIKSQTYPRREIIVVDNSSTDKTVVKAKKYTRIVITFGPERSAQRNQGALKSKGDYLLFLDADMRLTPRVVEECIEVIKNKTKIAGVAIPEQSVATEFWEKVKAFERSFYNENGDPITDAARFFRRSIFFKAGGYDETITGPEDWDLPETIRELGYRFNRIDEKILHKERATSLISLFKKKFYYGLHAHKYLKKHNISTFSPKTVYFLRPLFYKSWYRLLTNPLLSLGLVIMLATQLLGGGLGYIIGRIRDEN